MACIVDTYTGLKHMHALASLCGHHAWACIVHTCTGIKHRHALTCLRRKTRNWHAYSPLQVTKGPCICMHPMHRPTYAGGMHSHASNIPTQVYTVVMHRGCSLDFSAEIRQSWCSQHIRTIPSGRAPLNAYPAYMYGTEDICRQMHRVPPLLNTTCENNNCT